MPQESNPTPDEIAERGLEQQVLTLAEKGMIAPQRNGKVPPCSNSWCRKCRSTQEVFSYGSKCEDCFADAQIGRLGSREAKIRKRDRNGGPGRK